MAKKTHVTLTDDFDGGKADETVRFSLDGDKFEIDLNAKNAQKLREVFVPYVKVAQKVGAVKDTVGAGEQTEMRKWALQQGLEINPRGRLKKDIVDAYKAAHGGTAPADEATVNGEKKSSKKEAASKAA